MTASPPGVVVTPGSALGEALSELVREARMVFLAGLPGTGKSLLLHQIAHLAHARGRRVHRLQWDVARPPFEDSGAGRRYPAVAGVTHGIIRVAVGRWARHALGRWRGAHTGADLLIGETPLVGHRLVELARRHDDAVEGLLDVATTRFVIPVPSVEVRRHLEGERARRAIAPVHEQEREDASPAVLRDLWRELAAVAAALGLGVVPGNEGAPPWDPAVYARVYETVLRHRHPRVLALDTILPTATLSVYDFRVPCDDLVPTAAEVDRFVAEAAAAWPDAAALSRGLARWYLDDA